jgi:hypothetical protein
MSNNLFVSFQLADGQRSTALMLAAIEELGYAMPVFRRLWYVRSNLSAAEAAARLRAIMDQRDHLVVIDASNNEMALLNVEGRDCAILDVQWHRDVAIPGTRHETPMGFRNDAQPRGASSSA